MLIKNRFILFFILLIFQTTPNVNASHIVGGDISVQWTGTGNEFEITLKFYWDCTGTNYNNYTSAVDVGLYNQLNNNKIGQYSLALSGIPVELELGDSCLNFDGCIKVATFKRIITIPNNPSGYYVSFQQNSRSTNIVNIMVNLPTFPPSLAGVTIFTDIPDPTLQNSSPVFDSLPNGYMCINKTNIRSFKCTDADGDSLVYYLETPLDATDKSAPYVAPSSKPYDPVTWVTVPLTTYYNENNMIGGTLAMTINSETGEVTSNPDSLGIFVFAVRVEQYDKVTKVKLGETRRDVQYSVVLCENLPPEFTSPEESSFNIAAGDSLCFNLKLEDSNLKDSVYFSAVSELFNLTTNAPKAIFSEKKGIKIIDTAFCIYTYCGNEREAAYQVTFNGKDSSCYNNGVTSKTVDFYIYSPGDGYLQGFLPNVFTPNNDGINDLLKVNDGVKNCYDEFTVKIYDRWGDKIFESNDFFFQWNGTHYKSGEELSQGVYYYAVKGLFQDRSTEKKGYVTLLK